VPRLPQKIYFRLRGTFWGPRLTPCSRKVQTAVGLYLFYLSPQYCFFLQKSLDRNFSIGKNQSAAKFCPRLAPILLKEQQLAGRFCTLTKQIYTSKYEVVFVLSQNKSLTLFISRSV